jgi:glycosyltransferase involved in cell wall biosynthesis
LNTPCSIITPSRNQSDWLKLCVASVADQGLPGVQHIVQDANSDDATRDWLPHDPRIEAHIEADAGMYDAINRGLRRARGGFFAYLNCDEQYLPGVLTKVARVFELHPGVDVLFGDIVMVDEDGNYLCHRKVQVPLLNHTWTCHLSTLSCAMFFRRRLIETGRYFFNTDYRCGGDGDWMVRLLRDGVRMAALGEFTSVFTRTGANLGRDARAMAENQKLRETAPAWMRAGRPFWILHHRLRRWLAGAYSQPPFEISIYTRTNPHQRVAQPIPRPEFRQNW